MKGVILIMVELLNQHTLAQIHACTYTYKVSTKCGTHVTGKSFINIFPQSLNNRSVCMGKQASLELSQLEAMQAGFFGTITVDEKHKKNHCAHMLHLHDLQVGILHLVNLVQQLLLSLVPAVLFLQQCSATLGIYDPSYSLPL